MDDLDDNIGNYRSFNSLTGIVTADMQYHEKRQSRKPVKDGSGTEAPEKHAAETGRTSAAAKPAPQSLTVVSKGRTLIIDTDPGRAVDCGLRLMEMGVPCTLCLAIGADRTVDLPRTVWQHPLAQVDAVSVRGGFGGFTATVATDGTMVNLSSLLGGEGGSFDLVLDLQSMPSYAGTQLPLGYYAPGEDAADLEAALAELPEMRGRFKRPQYTVFLKDRCFHGRSRSRECRRCERICPVGAISSEGRDVVIDPYLCQGCGGCALVCPAAAIRLSQPTQEELLSSLRRLVVDSTPAAGPPPALILYDRQIDEKSLPEGAATATEGRIYYGLDEIGRLGLEVLLAALAYGAGSVSLYCEQGRPAAIREALQRQVHLGSTILEGLGMPAGRLCFTVLPAGRSAAENANLAESIPAVQHVEPVRPPAVFPPETDKRTLTRLAVQHLSEVSGAMPSDIVLPEEAPFGAVAIEAAACSLCMACAGTCPSGALAASGEVPRLSLVESRCHQCGLCVAACPEKAIRLLPRLRCDAEAVEASAVLLEAEPFHCIECGEAFASLAMVNRMQEKLSNHWMYSSDRQIRRLRLCRICRTRDALMARDFQS